MQNKHHSQRGSPYRSSGKNGQRRPAPPNIQRRRPNSNRPNGRQSGHNNGHNNDNGDLLFYIIIGLIAAIFISLVIIFSIVSTRISYRKPTDDTSGQPQITNGDDSTTTSDSSDTLPEDTTQAPKPKSTILQKTPDMGEEYIDRIVFLGDSTTNGMKRYQVLPGGRDTTQVWTPDGGTMTINESAKMKIVYPETGEEIYIHEAAARKKPDILVITLGHNFYSKVTDKEKIELYFKAEYKKLIGSIKEASPDTKIILQSIFPIVTSVYKHSKTISNEVINERNSWILDVAEEMNLYYLDTASYFKDENGDMIEKYTNGDGCHFNADGYRRELEYIRTHALPD